MEKPLPITPWILAALGFGECGGAIYGSGPVKEPETH